MSKKLLFNFNREVIQNYTYVKYVGAIITATNTLEKPIKSAILKGSTKYRDIDTGEFLETFEEGRNLELVSVKMPVLTVNNNVIDLINVEYEYGIYFGQKADGNDWVNGKGTVSSFVYTLNYIELLSNRTKLTTYGNDTIIDRIVWFDENKNQIGTAVGVNNRTLNIPTGAKYVRFLLNDSRFTEGKELAKDNVGHYNIYYGDESQIFNNEPHKSNILTVNEEVELGSVGEVKDELNLLTGQLTQRTETRAYQEGDELNSEFVTDMINTRYKLAQEVVKTVDLSILDQNENKVSSISSFNDTTHIMSSSETIPPTFEGYLATKEVE